MELCDCNSQAVWQTAINKGTCPGVCGHCDLNKLFRMLPVRVQCADDTTRSSRHTHTHLWFYSKKKKDRTVFSCFFKFSVFFCCRVCWREMQTVKHLSDTKRRSVCEFEPTNKHTHPPCCGWRSKRINGETRV